MSKKSKIIITVYVLIHLVMWIYAISVLIKVSDREKEINVLEQRIRDINEELERKIFHGLDSTLNLFNQAETIIDNTKTIVKKEQQITNEYVQNSYLLMSIPDSTQLKVYDANMELYRERFAKGYYHISGHNN